MAGHAPAAGRGVSTAAAPSQGPATGLAAKLARRIRRQGPIPVADYMAACLADPAFGYYRWRDPLGAAGDFTTAPEVSQIFGELVGLWCTVVWRQMGAPGEVRLIELGPGRGTLMADALRAAGLDPEFLAAARVHLVETSPVLRTRQRERLEPWRAALAWHDRLDEVPDGPAILLANEFLDALPVHQFVRRGGAWHERCVGLDAEDRFVFCLAPQAAEEPGLPDILCLHAGEDAVAEVRPQAATLVAALGERARRHPLAALIIDYGHTAHGLGDTLQAVRGHTYADPLGEPGEADLTAHVDFEALVEAAGEAQLSAHGPLPQGRFLLALGLAQRCERLARDNPAAAETIVSGARRLVDPQQMGALFKVLALTGAGQPKPPGFEAP